MPPKKVAASVVIFDANSSEEFKKRAVNCYKEICERIYFSDNENVSKLFLTNARKENSNQTTFYVTDYVCYNPCNRQHLETAPPAAGNWLSGLQDAVDDLYSCFDNKLYSKYQILVLSDLNSQLDMEPKAVQKKIERIVNTINEFCGYIYFLGIDVQPRELIRSKLCVHKWAQNMDVDKTNANYGIAARIVKESLGIVCDFDIGTDLFITYFESTRGFPFNEPLSFGDQLQLQTSVMKFIDEKSSMTPRNVKGCINTKFVLMEDQDVIVQQEDVTEGRVFHEKLIIIPSDVSKGIKDYPRFFKLLGFTDSKNVPNHYMLSDSTNLITSNEQTDPEVGYINYIIEAAETYNKYGIALKAHMKNSRPKLYCLIPKTSPHYFIMVELPYSEDILSLYKEYDLKSYKIKHLASEDTKVEDELKADIFTYLDSINLDDKIRLHPNRRESDTKKRAASILLDKFESREIKKTPLNLFGIKFETNSELEKKFESKFKNEDAEPEDLW